MWVGGRENFMEKQTYRAQAVIQKVFYFGNFTTKAQVRLVFTVLGGRNKIRGMHRPIFLLGRRGVHACASPFV